MGEIFTKTKIFTYHCRKQDSMNVYRGDSRTRIRKSTQPYL